MDAGYWYDNLRQTVRFDAAVRVAVEAGHTTFVEVGPHPVLTDAGHDVLLATRVSLASAADAAAGPGRAAGC